jgi:4-hydroxy-tetrahydrodipicolinate synthase
LSTDNIHGIVVPIITPVDEEDRVDEVAFRKVIRYLIEAGVHGLFIGGSAGEGPLFTLNEWTRMMEIALDEARDAIPLLGGVMETSTRRAVEKINILQDIGYQNIVVSPTYYITTRSGDEHLRLFGACKEAAPDREIIAYNIPSCTNSSIVLESFLEMARRGWVRYCKESSGSPELLLPLIEQGRELGMRVLVGEERLMYDGLLAGGVGAVPVGANYEPETYIRIYEAGVRGDKEELARWYERSRYVCGTLTGGTSWLAGIKYALSQRGMGNGRPVSPLQPTDDERKKLIDSIIPVEN